MDVTEPTFPPRRLTERDLTASVACSSRTDHGHWSVCAPCEGAGVVVSEFITEINPLYTNQNTSPRFIGLQHTTPQLGAQNTKANS
ncbi:hypothetical protein Btru_074967 [Bulinus truncatus]|nr:hypothetical protein Btru_074967 [Bulinus truncatus]